MVVLVVEDEEKIAQFIRTGLLEAGHAVEVVSSGEAALKALADKEYGIIILDVVLPGRSGIEVCRSIRDLRMNTPILMLSALSAVADKIEGLDAGADDYLTKPFSFEEFLARIRALSRKKDTIPGNPLVCSDLTIDVLTRKVERGGRSIELSNKEYALLEYLMKCQGRVVTRNMISEHVWNLDFHTSTNVIEVYINYLRKKVDADSPEKLIRTLRGRGYLLGNQD